MSKYTNGVNGHTNGDTSGANGHASSAICASAHEFLNHKYDFVIVGGGTAGLTIAARLTENPDVHVGVLEAGPNKLGDVLVDTPVCPTRSWKRSFMVKLTINARPCF